MLRKMKDKLNRILLGAWLLGKLISNFAVHQTSNREFTLQEIKYDSLQLKFSRILQTRLMLQLAYG